jgi:hypothetical protein
MENTPLRLRASRCGRGIVRRIEEGFEGGVVEIGGKRP